VTTAARFPASNAVPLRVRQKVEEESTRGDAKYVTEILGDKNKEVRREKI